MVNHNSKFRNVLFYIYFSECTPFHVAAKKGHLNVCKMINGSIDFKDNHPLDNNGWISLYEICEWILDLIDSNEKSPIDYKGVTPPQIAAKNSDQNICELIINIMKHKNSKDNGVSV